MPSNPRPIPTQVTDTTSVATDGSKPPGLRTGRPLSFVRLWCTRTGLSGRSERHDIASPALSSKKRFCRPIQASLADPGRSLLLATGKGGA